MKPTAYLHSPRVVLETTMLAADQCSRHFLQFVFQVAFENGKAIPARPPAPAPTEVLTPLPNEAEEDARAAAEEEVGNLLLLGDLAGAHSLACSELALLSHVAAQQPTAEEETEQDSATAVLGTALAGEGRDDEAELQQLAAQSVGEQAVLATRGRGTSAAKPCERASELSSAWLEELKLAVAAVKAGGTLAELCESLVALREATEKRGNCTDTKARTPEEAARKAAMHAHQRGAIQLDADEE
eukprot:2195649-Prymnesium_polylepis.1